jgi:hypothetical protein
MAICDGSFEIQLVLRVQVKVVEQVEEEVAEEWAGGQIAG